MTQLGRHGTKLSFSSKNPSMSGNTRFNCFDPYWGRTNKYQEYHKKKIYFSFDYLHIQTEEFLEELNKTLSYITIELINKKEVTVYAWEDSYGKRFSLKEPLIKLEVEKKKVLTGIYKVTMDDFFLSKTRDLKNPLYDRYGKIAQTIVYLCHHILCSLAVSEDWLNPQEKINLINFSDYKVKDLFGFIAYLTNNRNKGTNRKLSTNIITGEDIKQIGNKKKILYLCKYPALFSMGKQTRALNTFSIPVTKMNDKVSLHNSRIKLLEKRFGKVGAYSIIKHRYKRYNTYSGYRYDEITDLVKIKHINIYTLQVIWDIISSTDKHKVTSNFTGAFVSNQFTVNRHSFIKNPETGKYMLSDIKKLSSSMQKITKVTKRQKNSKFIKEVIKGLEAKIEYFEVTLVKEKKTLNASIKVFEKAKIPTASSSDFSKKYTKYTDVREQFFTARKRCDGTIYTINRLKNTINEIKNIVT